jgi:hypothetical protein
VLSVAVAGAVRVVVHGLENAAEKKVEVVAEDGVEGAVVH